MNEPLFRVEDFLHGRCKRPGETSSEWAADRANALHEERCGVAKFKSRSQLQRAIIQYPTLVIEEIERLRAENDDAYQRGLLEGSKVGDATAKNFRHENDALIELLRAERAAVLAENTRLRDALTSIQNANGSPNDEDFVTTVARAALEVKP